MDARRREGGDGGGDDDDVDDFLVLTLGSIYAAAPTPQVLHPPPSPPSALRSTRRRLNSPDPAPAVLPQGRDRNEDEASKDDDRAPGLYAWVLARPAQHDTLENLLLKGVTSVQGVARCKRCFVERTVVYDLEAKFREVSGYIAANALAMDDRAPDAWMCPLLPDCAVCGSTDCLLPGIPRDKFEINWMFLFLGQMLGCCTLEELKYFCKHTNKQRTGAKNRVLYHVYVEMCRQLEPQGPFNF